MAIDWSPEVEAGLKELRKEAVIVNDLFTKVRAETIKARTDVAKLIEIVPERQEAIKNLRVEVTDHPLVPPSALESDLLDGDYLDTLPDRLTADLDDLDTRLESKREAITGFVARIDSMLKDGPQMNDEELYQALEERVISRIPELLLRLGNDALELSLVLTSARAESINLIPIDLTVPEAYSIAEKNRLDWMNQRAQLMDQWRLIAFNADRLESDLSLQLQGSISNTEDDPFRFRDTTGSLRAGLSWDAPITRLRERNIYRQSLLEYQNALRQYYRYEDGQFLAMKSALRDIMLQKINFEATRKQLQVSLRNVLFQKTQIQQPPGQAGNTLSPETASRLINSLSGLQGTQDGLLGVWVGYELNRGQLDFLLGTMSLDEEGAWIDPGAIGPIWGYPPAPEDENEDDADDADAAESADASDTEA